MPKNQSPEKPTTRHYILQKKAVAVRPLGAERGASARRLRHLFKP